MRTLCLTVILSFMLGPFLHAGMITSSGIGSFARNNTPSQASGTDIQDLNDNQWVGYKFTVGSADISVSSLGVWDGPNSGSTVAAGFQDGLQQAAPVELWTVGSGNAGGTLVASATVPASTMGGSDEFAYTSISPVTLSANAMYILVAQYMGEGNAIYNAGSTIPAANGGNGNALTTMAGVDIVENRFTFTGNASPDFDQDPNAGTGYIQGYVGPSLEFTAVPEPSSFLFLGLLLTGIAWNKRRVSQ